MIDNLFETLADPSRRRILTLLRDGERSAGEVVQALGMSQPAVSKHLKALRIAGFAEVRAEAARRIYRLRPEPLAELDAWLDPFRRYWSGKLDSLERYLDEED
jgi:DNA-binding transcriptional ArsR family regulator